jgi:dipeptidyl aminopeptidase/acylaminoacyl peptidase
VTVIHTRKASDASAGSSSPAALRPETEDQPTEVLFPEAKRRERKRRLIAVSALLVVSAAATAVATSFGGSSRPSGPLTKTNAVSPVVSSRAFAHEGLLAFTSDQKLYVLDGNNGVLRQVGTAKTGAEEPTFSHDEKWLAYIAAGAETKTDFGEEAPYAPFTGPLVISSAEGGGATRITNIGPISSLEWSPTGDRLLVVSGSSPYYGNAVWLVSPTGQSRRLYSGESVFGAVWSPNGSQVAIAIQRPRGEGPTTLETLPASGGASRVWSQPITANEQWLVPIGWWKDQGIGLWVGGNGSTPDGDGSLDGATLMIASSPGAQLRSLGHTPPVAMIPAVSSKIGWLAVDEGGDRDAWAKKSIETCAPGDGRCSSIPEPPSETAFDPVWSPDGTELAFVEAPTNENSSFAPSKIRAWYASGQLEVFAAGKSQAVSVRHTLGATAPQWSPTGHALLYVANDALYLIRKSGDSPVRIAGPLLPSSQWTSTYYGGIDWRFMFAWAAR